MTEIKSIIEAKMKTGESSDPSFPDVFVGRLAADVRAILAEGKPVAGVKLGLGQNVNFQLKLTEAMVENLHAQLMKEANDAFILIWDGNKIPRGAEVNGHRIGWTQNGEVRSDTGETIGVYDRLLEFGGVNGKEQQMMVFLTADPIIG